MIVKIVCNSMAENELLRSAVLETIVLALQTEITPVALRTSFTVEIMERRVHAKFGSGVPREGMNWPYRRDYDKTRLQSEG